MTSFIAITGRRKKNVVKSEESTKDTVLEKVVSGGQTSTESNVHPDVEDDGIDGALLDMFLNKVPESTNKDKRKAGKRREDRKKQITSMLNT